jgi:hypothetical protein
VIRRSHAPSRSPGRSHAGGSHAPGVLTLQRMAGNRAVRALIARDSVVKVGGEQVRVASKAQEEDAARIIKAMKEKYGVAFDSIAARGTTRKHYGDMGAATDAQLKSVEAAVWDYAELQAVERALKHFAPVLGEARKKSSLKSAPQEIHTVGKLTTAPDDDPKHPEDKTRGEYFGEAQTFALFEPGPDGLTDVDSLEAHATHEMAHGVFGSQLGDFMKATGYWAQKLVKSKKAGAERPPDGYADTNAGEDLAQSVMYFFTDPDRLKNGRKGWTKDMPYGGPCPKRYEFIKRIVGGWTPKRR